MNRDNNIDIARDIRDISYKNIAEDNKAPESKSIFAKLDIIAERSKDTPDDRDKEIEA